MHMHHTIIRADRQQETLFQSTQLWRFPLCLRTFLQNQTVFSCRKHLPYKQAYFQKIGLGLCIPDSRSCSPSSIPYNGHVSLKLR